MIIKKKLPELLAPAGNLACGITAFKFGADAVYAGLNKFNARERTENFSMIDLSRLINYARENNKKVYITLNTLIKEQELPKVMEILAELAFLNPDAIIVQDLGVLHLIKKYFPTLKIHASTQMGIHNSAGVRSVQSLGIERVILERQVTHDELTTISQNTDCELEVFVHGALCCSLSTTCLLSSWMGGWSGNRGKCKQACRRRFFSKNDGNGFFFSTHDLYSLENIPFLKELGVASLKIEGRLKQGDYVKNTVSAYRLMLDTEDCNAKVIKEAKAMLMKSLGRKWHHGFTSEENLKSVVKSDAQGVSGLLCGHIEKRVKGGFVIAASRRLHLGDKIRIQQKNGEDNTSITITKMSKTGSSTRTIARDEKGLIHCDKAVDLASKIYKIGESAPNFDKEIAQIAEIKSKINLEVEVYINQITVKTSNLANNLTWSKKIVLEQAISNPLNDSTISKAFNIVKNDKFKTGEVTSKINGEFFMHSKILKECRREFWEFVNDKVDILTLKQPYDIALMNFVKDYKKRGNRAINHQEKNTVSVLPNRKGFQKETIIAKPVFNYSKKTNEAIIPPFCQEDKLKTLETAIKIAYETGARRFRITSIYALDILKKYEDISIVASYPLPVCNSATCAELKNNKVIRAQGWIELEKEAFEDLIKKSDLPIEIYRYGRPVIFATRAKIQTEGTIADKKGNKFDVVNNKKTGLTYIFPNEILSMPSFENATNFYDYENAGPNEKERSSFNLDLELL